MNILGTVWTLYPRGFSGCHAIKFRAFYYALCAFWAQ